MQELAVQYKNGFSLLELMLTLAVSSIVMSIAFGNFSGIVSRAKQTALINHFITTVLQARAHAITKNQYALICPSSDGALCSDDAQWMHGWILISGETAHDVTAAAGQFSVLHYRRKTDSLVIQANRNYFLFRPHAKRATNGTVRFCPRALSAPGKAVIISYTGRPRVSNILSNGGEVSCNE